MAAHHYAIDAAKLLEKCHASLTSILDCLEERSNNSTAFRRRALQLIELNDALRCTERLIHTHLLDLLDREMEFLSLFDHKEHLQFFGQHSDFPSLSDTVATLVCAEKTARKYRKDGDGSSLRSSSPKRTTSHQRLYSEPAMIFNQMDNLAIDDPVEEDDGGGWYFGGRSSPPSSLTIEDSILNHDIHVTKPAAVSPSRHRRYYSTGNLDSPPRVNGKAIYPTRSAKDSSLFRLIVTLQLCLVRLEEANSVLCKGKASLPDGQRDRGNSDADLSLIRTCTSSNSFDYDSVSYNTPGLSNKDIETTRWRKSTMLTVTLGMGAIYYSKDKIKDTTTAERIQMLKSVGKLTMGLLAARFVRTRWRTMCMNARVSDTAESIQDWIFSWICLVNENSAGADRQMFMPEKYNSWYSFASIRFQLIKRGMDLFYASIGKAIELTRGQQESQDTSPESTDTKSSNLWTYVVASLAASYYNVIGPAAKSSQVIQNARGAKSVIQNAWGVVSLPAIKRASLEATRILKGAAIADRIEIDGISCFVLSREPFPALTSALRRYRRQQQREDVRLGTIHEQLSLGHASVNVSGFVRRNVIFHLTGGGFYAHTIAGDLPYLLDWSAATDSVVIIPEYALLPEHKFPDAIAQITQLYRAVRCGQAATLLGFHANKIIVSGESAGGNLAAALCVTIIMDRDESEYVQLTPSKSMDLVTDQEESFEEEDEGEEPFGVPMNEGGIPLPDAVLLSCPALNLSLETSPSRLVGADDPVLPSGLVAAISNSYLPIDGEFHKTHPIASPYFASDETLSQFPPTLIFTSYEDPFLDDSVNFNARLRAAGVKSRLRAVHHMPHAFWALCTAGIPEARQVQQECVDWLSRMFRHR